MNMKRIFFLLVVLSFAFGANAQDKRNTDKHSYVMGYKTATISADKDEFFSQLHFPGQNPVCGFYDRWSGNFYTCDYSTYRDIDEDHLEPSNLGCCETLDFDARKYYGSITLNGTVDTVEWDNLIIKMTTANAKIAIKTDEKEIDAFYKNFYKKSRFGKLKIRLTLVTYDNVVENRMDMPKRMKKIKKRKKLVKFLRF